MMGGLGEGRHVQTLGNLRANRKVLVRWNGDRRENSNDRHDDHQLDQRKAFLLSQFNHIVSTRRLGFHSSGTG